MGDVLSEDASSPPAKYGGLEVSKAKRPRAFEEENARLKRLLADTMLDNAGLKDLLPKKCWAESGPPWLLNAGRATFRFARKLAC